MFVELLYPLVFAEMGLILILSFRSPLRRLLIKVLDRTKHGRGPVVVQTVATTFLVVFAFSLHGLNNVRSQLLDSGGMGNPTEQVLMAYHLLEASLLGFSLFLGLVIDRLHYYLREINLLRQKVDDNNHDKLRREEADRSTKRSNDAAMLDQPPHID